VSIALAFMQAQGIARGLLFTADPYSKIVDPEDKNTSLLFGDAATVTLLGDAPVYVPGPFTFGTRGKDHAELACAPGGRLVMNGHAIFNFAAVAVPLDLRRLSERAGIPLEKVDRFLLHQGSRFIVDTIVQRAKLDPAKVPFACAEYGNTVSSSIPIMLEKEIAPGGPATMVMSGFGVGLAYASAFLRRVEPSP
jgi:3-oxoacyl-[acyl-carrier-protein] synthase-3